MSHVSFLCSLLLFICQVSGNSQVMSWVQILDFIILSLQNPNLNQSILVRSSASRFPLLSSSWTLTCNSQTSRRPEISFIFFLVFFFDFFNLCTDLRCFQVVLTWKNRSSNSQNFNSLLWRFFWYPTFFFDVFHFQDFEIFNFFSKKVFILGVV